MTDQAFVERLLAFVFGFIFIVTILVLAIQFPEPTSFQYTVFRIILALAAAGIAVVIPGVLKVIGNFVRAGGAMAIFVIVYFYSPAQLVSDLQKQAEDQFNRAIKVPTSYQEKYATFTDEPNSAIFILLRDPRLGEMAGKNGGGTYYSFVRKTHDYGYGSDINFENGMLATGFAGADYGYFLSVGNIPIETLIQSNSSKSPEWLIPEKQQAWEYVWNYKPPSDIEEIRKHQKDARGKVIGGTNISDRVAATEGSSYLLRSILIDESDILVAFRIEKILEDGSLVIVSRIIKTFDTPISVGNE